MVLKVFFVEIGPSGSAVPVPNRSLNLASLGYASKSLKCLCKRKASGKASGCHRRGWLCEFLIHSTHREQCFGDVPAIFFGHRKHPLYCSWSGGDCKCFQTIGDFHAGRKAPFIFYVGADFQD